MNIFDAKKGIIGEAPVAHLNRTLTEFFEQANGIRITLGKQSYLLDKYISYLLETANKTIASNAASASFEVDSTEMNRVCFSVLRHESKYREHPLYEQVREYIDSHPLPYQEVSTRHFVYCVMLEDEFLRFVTERYRSKLEQDFNCAADIVDLRDLYRQICGILDGEESMERLNLLFRQRFLIATAMQIYLQGLTNQLMYSLVARDRETQKQVFQIVLDEQLLPIRDKTQ